MREGVSIAEDVLRSDYVYERIDIEELERRLEYVVGLRGRAAQDEALSTLERIEVSGYTAYGGTEYLPTGWEWPQGL